MEHSQYIYLIWSNSIFRFHISHFDIYTCGWTPVSGRCLKLLCLFFIVPSLSQICHMFVLFFSFTLGAVRLRNPTSNANYDGHELGGSPAAAWEETTRSTEKCSTKKKKNDQFTLQLRVWLSHAQPCSTRLNQASPGFTRLHQVPPGFALFHNVPVQPGSAGLSHAQPYFARPSQAPLGFSQVPQGSATVNPASQVSTRLHKVPPVICHQAHDHHSDLPVLGWFNLRHFKNNTCKYYAANAPAADP